MEDIPRLIPILGANEHFECKISMKCPLTQTVKFIRDILKDNPTDLQWLKEETQFGHFLNISYHYKHSSQMMWLLLVRQAQCSRAKEMWFIINGKPLRFSLMEYTLITGLKSSEYPDWYNEQCKSTAFRERHFRGKKIITIEDIKQKLMAMAKQSQRKKGQRNNEKIKMALVLFVSSVLFNGDKPSTGIDQFIMGMVEDLDKFDKFPCGKLSYETLFKHLQKSLKEKAQALIEQGEKESTFTYLGFIIPLAVSKLPLHNINF